MLEIETKLSQEDLAKKAGITYSTLIKIESGYTPNPSIQNVANIAKALNVSINDLISKKK